MREIRLYTPQPLDNGSHIELDPVAAHHLGKVLRASEGDLVTLFNGEGVDWVCKVSRVDKKSLWVEVTAPQEVPTEAPIHTHLGLCLSKGDRFDWGIQKATELGVSEITPLFSERVDVKIPADRLSKRVAHWQQVVISACEQCGRARVPTVNPPIQLSTWIGMTSGTLKWVMHHQASGDFPSSSPESIDLLIGPEGGLSDEEVGAANVAGFQSLQLGPRVLRTETAPVVALSVIAARWGDFE